MGKTKNAWWKHRLIATLLVVMTVFATCITPALAAYDKNVDYGQKMAQLPTTITSVLTSVHATRQTS